MARTFSLEDDTVKHLNRHPLVAAVHLFDDKKAVEVLFNNASFLHVRTQHDLMLIDSVLYSAHPVVREVPPKRDSNEVLRELIFGKEVAYDRDV